MVKRILALLIAMALLPSPGITVGAEDNDVLIPLEKPSHSYALPVTWKELERILAVYPDGQ